jgi:uncharacterized BrkB/YihY/UPF0761 family membrane protein
VTERPGWAPQGLGRVGLIRHLLPDLIVWARTVSHRMDETGVRLYAAAIAYRTIFAILALSSTVGIILIIVLGPDADAIRPASESGVADDLTEVGRERAARTLELGAGPAWVAASIGLAVGLYTLAGGFAALCDVLDRVHGTHTYRRYSMRMLRGAGIAVIALVIIAVALASFIVTTELGEFVFGIAELDLLSGATTLVLAVLVPSVTLLGSMILLLRYGSHARPAWGQVIPGGIVATAAIAVTFGGFVTYARFLHGFEAYGALAGAIAVLVFGYLLGYIIILTALFRNEITYLASLVPGLRRTADGSSVHIQLPAGLRTPFENDASAADHDAADTPERRPDGD